MLQYISFLLMPGRSMATKKLGLCSKRADWHDFSAADGSIGMHIILLHLTQILWQRQYVNIYLDHLL